MSDKYEKINYKEIKIIINRELQMQNIQWFSIFFAQCVLFIITRLDMRKY